MLVLVAKDAAGAVVGSLEIDDRPQAIGRGSGCALVLPSQGVSRRHATVYRHGADGIVISDEGSANGVRVDGALITGPTLVDHSNSIQLSDYWLELRPDSTQVGQSVPQHAIDASSAAAPPAAVDRGALAEFDEGRLLDTCLEAYEGAAAALASAQLELVCDRGPFKRKRFVVDKPLISVGRADDNDIVLDHPSISRRHAQIRLAVAGDHLTLLDLRSQNGVFLGKQRIKRAEVEIGNVVRIGDILLTLRRRQELKRRKRMASLPRGAKIAFAAAAGGALSVLLVLYGVSSRPNKAPPPPTIEDRLGLLQQGVARLIDEARRKVSLRSWSDAIVVLDKALAKDPLEQDAKQLRVRALRELSNSETYAEAMKYFQIGGTENLLKAKQVFARIDRASAYRPEARQQITAIDQRVASAFHQQAAIQCPSRRWQECHHAVCSYFDLAPDDRSVDVARLRGWLASAERRLAGKGGFTPCPKGRPAPAPVDASQEVLSRRYPSAKLRRVVARYVSGRFRAALQGLAALRARPGPEVDASQLAEVHRQLLTIHGKYREGFTASRLTRIADADRLWSVMLAADRSLVPAPLESQYRREVLGSLGDLYFRAGEEQFKAGRLRQAAKLWKRGKQLNASHDRLLTAMLQLKKIAERSLRRGRDLAAEGKATEARAKLELARDICDGQVCAAVEVALAPLVQ